MLAAAGATITSMPSSEIYSGLQTGVLDGANTSSSSLVSYRIYEQVAKWRKIADESSYKAFANDASGGRELLDQALSVD
jgi:hypothetical protein